MGSRGHKGAIGMQGGMGIPKFIQEIVNFRNNKYNEDLTKSREIKGKTYDDVDGEYDVIDAAIYEMMTKIVL